MRPNSSGMVVDLYVQKKNDCVVQSKFIARFLNLTYTRAQKSYHTSHAAIAYYKTAFIVRGMGICTKYSILFFGNC